MISVCKHKHARWLRVRFMMPEILKRLRLPDLSTDAQSQEDVLEENLHFLSGSGWLSKTLLDD